MENLQGYLRWRGDITFAERSFNVVDNLVLCALSYLDLGDVVPTPEEGGSVSISDAATRLASPGDQGLRARDDRRLAVVPPSFLADMAASARFATALLSNHVDIVDEAEGTQFSAVTVQLGDGSTFIAFRGTDFTLLGWQEDFTMSYRLMPSQLQAADYLRDRVSRRAGPVRVGGHSKGGNLAVYAAMSLPEPELARIARVYCNDGPGVSSTLVDAGQLARLDDRVERIIPAFGVVGMLFDRGEAKRIIASTARGLVQHDLMTWRVQGTDIVEAQSMSSHAEFINATIDSWLAKANDRDRQDFTEGFFGALREGGARLITELGNSEYGSYESVLVALRRVRGKTRRSTWLGIRAAVSAARRVDFVSMLRERAVVRAGLAAVLGAFLLVVPDLALQVLGSLAAFILIVLVAMRSVAYLRSSQATHQLTWWQVPLWLGVLVGAIVGITHIDAFVTPTNLLLAVALIAHAWVSAQRAIRIRTRRPRRRSGSVLLTLSAVMSLILGIVALSTFDRVLPLFMMAVGQYLLIAGLVELMVTTYQRALGSIPRADELWTRHPLPDLG